MLIDTSHQVCFHTQICEMENVRKCIEEALESLNIRRESRKIILKEEQERAVKVLISGNDVLAILPTGFGKSMIYKIFTLASQKMRSAKTSPYCKVHESIAHGSA